MELLERFARGDLEAFETLFRQFQNQVYGWIITSCRGIVGFFKEILGIAG